MQHQRAEPGDRWRAEQQASASRVVVAVRGTINLAGRASQDSTTFQVMTGADGERRVGTRRLPGSERRLRPQRAALLHRACRPIGDGPDHRGDGVEVRSPHRAGATVQRREPRCRRGDPQVPGADSVGRRWGPGARPMGRRRTDAAHTCLSTQGREATWRRLCSSKMTATRMLATATYTVVNGPATADTHPATHTNRGLDDHGRLGDPETPPKC